MTHMTESPLRIQITLTQILRLEKAHANLRLTWVVKAELCTLLHVIILMVIDAQILSCVISLHV